jgi:hypothetical protein
MEIDKISVGLIVGIIVCAVMAFALPTMAVNTATQSATITQSTTFEFYNQTGAGADTIVGTLNITGVVGAELFGTGLYNDIDGEGSPQNISDADAPIARIKNTDNNIALIAYAKVTDVSEWNEHITSEFCLLDDTTAKPATGGAINVDLSDWGTAVTTGKTISANSYANLWIRVVPQMSTSTSTPATSTFTVLGEGS